MHCAYPLSVHILFARALRFLLEQTSFSLRSLEAVVILILATNAPTQQSLLIIFCAKTGLAAAKQDALITR